MGFTRGIGGHLKINEPNYVIPVVDDGSRNMCCWVHYRDYDCLCCA
jgi:hypothetical protein